MSNVNIKTASQAFKQGENIMKLFRDEDDSGKNTPQAIEVSYDLQSGSYSKQRLAIPGNKSPSLTKNETYTQHIAELFDQFSPHSILNAGVGESTTLSRLIEKMQHKPAHIYGLDISWSRIAFGKAFAAHHQQTQQLFVGNMLNIPLCDNSIELVFTSHAVEPNGGNERAILQELTRVASKYVILLEPAYELGTDATKAHIEKHGYCRGLKATAEELGHQVVAHRLFDYSINPNNQTAVTIIKVAEHASEPAPQFACPCCASPLVEVKGHLYCREDYMIFPVIDGIPCLKAEHGILGSKFEMDIRF